MAILQDMTQATDMVAEIARLRAENEALKAKAQAKVWFKVTDKGAVSVYGMGKWPVTLYLSQWQRLFAAQSGLKDFIEANLDKLSTKD